MSQALKIVVSGPVGSGKTTLIKTLSETNIVNTDEISSDIKLKFTTTVALDFGTLNLPNKSVSLFGTPGQERFDFMWEILNRGADGLLLLVNGARFQDFPKARQMLQYFTSQAAIPFIIGVTHQDCLRRWEPADVALYFEVPSCQVISLDARDRASSFQALIHLFHLAGLQPLNRRVEERCELLS